MQASSRPARRTFAVAAAAIGIPFLLTAAAVFTHAGGEWTRAVVGDVSYLAFVGAAFATASWAALRARGRLRHGWLGLAIGLGGATAGEALWSWIELVQRRENPFPSPADIGFLLLPLGAAAGLALFPSPSGGRRWRDLLDGLTAGTALVLISWATALGVVVRDGAVSKFTFAVSLAYPAGDLLVLTMVVLAVSRPSTQRWKLGLVGAGMSILALCDSGYTYLNSIGKAGANDLLLVGWLAGFSLLALAPFAPDAATAGRLTRRAQSSVAPYLPLAASGLVLLGRMVAGHRLDGVTQILMAVLVLLILVRQFVTLRDNRALMAEVASSREELRRQALHDALTGLPNRTLLLDRIRHALDTSQREEREVAVMFLDLDGFKAVNDSFGHPAGDELLTAVADRLGGVVRAGDTLARLGGDEFVILLEGPSVTAGIEVMARRVVDAFRAPFLLGTTGDEPIHVQASVGVAAGDRTSSADDLVRDADVAMYEAKAAGKDRYVLFTPAMQVAIQDQLSLERDLRTALAADQFFLLYQPTVDLQTCAISGVEALVRWQHPVRGELPPDQFIALCESSGMIVPLGAWVLREACRQAAAWAADGRPLSISVNVSARQLEHGGLLVDVATALEDSGLDPALLTIEVTESTLMEDTDASTRRLQELKALGVGIAIDDFGTGYSSLAYLRQFPVDALKIDRSFIAGMVGNEDATMLVGTMVQLGKALGLETYAEGIEEEDQLEQLRDHACDRGQGYFFSRPVSATAIDDLVDAPLALALERLG